MKIIWALVAIFLACLALGGFMSFVKGDGWFGILIGACLGWAAWGVWKGGVAGRSPQAHEESDRPRHR